jgi:hypothetical protein
LDAKEFWQYSQLAGFIEHHIMCFMKFFDSSLPDDDPNNFYMEREWRVVGDVEFDLKDVCRIILPKAFAKRFRNEHPDYAGALELL